MVSSCGFILERGTMDSSMLLEPNTRTSKRKSAAGSRVLSRIDKSVFRESIELLEKLLCLKTDPWLRQKTSITFVPALRRNQTLQE